MSYEPDWDDDGGEVSDLGLSNIEDTTISFDDAITPPTLPGCLPDKHDPTEDSKQLQMGGPDSFEVQGVQ